MASATERLDQLEPRPIPLTERAAALAQRCAELARLHAERAIATGAWRTNREREIKAELERNLARAKTDEQRSLAAAERELRGVRTTASRDLEAGHSSIEGEHQGAVERITSESHAREKRAERARHDALWLARTVYEAKRDQLQKQLRLARKQARARQQAATSIAAAADQCLVDWGQGRMVAEVRATGHEWGDNSTAHDLNEALRQANEKVAALRSLHWPVWAQSSRLGFVIAIIAAIVVPLAGWVLAWQPAPWAIASSLSVLAIAMLACWQICRLARRDLLATYLPLIGDTRQAEKLAREALSMAVTAFQLERAKSRQTRAEETNRARIACERVFAECATRRDTEIPALTTRASEQLSRLQADVEERVALAEAKHATLTTEAQVRAAEATRQAREQAVVATAQFQGELARRLDEDTQTRERDETACRAEAALIDEQAHACCPDWNSPTTLSPSRLPEAIRFGTLTVAAEWPAGEIPAAPVMLPALLRFPQELSLCVKIAPGGEERATDFLRLVALRLLASLPAGKARFTLIDPHGLGRPFASFMHLADHDEQLLGSRIWTEPEQIEERLAELSEHIERVLQKYLRDEFASLEEYNRAAGEVAEPYRFLVIANWPAGFTEAATRRLLRIIASGPRCGVYVLLSTDAGLRAISPGERAEFQSRFQLFQADRERIAWQGSALSGLPLAIDDLPSPGETKRLLEAIGVAAAGAKRVEVPFEAIAPPSDRLWQYSAKEGIDVPIGRAGATRLQHLRLGQGTSQHVLITGKTGSGKSTLLHALVTNAALRYSPDELEIYLIDFKKGVEFKTYVTHALPHARVVAIESEREFGLSVMQRLDREMQERGEAFRAAGVQDLPGYRAAGQRMPRVLFIVDEFQEFFVQDDRLAQEAALLLDRLVRQGRAFGIHVHLGSQTLGGAYTLARSTLGQMAVRIALQCSEADAHPILSEDNSAARLLSRPGEAIYNDANGFVEGNHPFQVVWLADERREHHLQTITRLADANTSRAETIVFEGARPAELERSAATNSPAQTAHPRAWLGEPLSLRESTSVEFTPRSGANLLVLGQNQEAASGLVAASLAGLLSTGNSKARVWLLDATGAEAPHRPILARWSLDFAARLKSGGIEQAEEFVAQVGAELAARQAGENDGPPLFLFVLGLARFRQLRRQEMEFGFSRSGEETRAKPDQQFAEILRDGPAVGVHTFVWCDTLSAFQRQLERAALREFNYRALLQMSATDSSLLIDSPLAGQLGQHRALLHVEDEGRLEKFRPFAVPALDWASEFAKRRID